MRSSSSKSRLKAGDVFTIPLSESKVGFGQIVCFPRTSSVFIICVYGYVVTGSIKSIPDGLFKEEIIFLGATTDAKIYHGDWIVIGNSVGNLCDILLPYYKLGSPPDPVYIVDVSGQIQKEISLDVFEKLDYKFSCSPVRYQNALKAYTGLINWEDQYDLILYSRTLDSNRIYKCVMDS